MANLADLCGELFRLDLMRRLEETLAGAGLPAVAGVDEAGRGCLAGPVVAAAVIPDPARPVPGVDDSKKVHRRRRERTAAAIRDSALAWAVGYWVSQAVLSLFTDPVIAPAVGTAVIAITSGLVAGAITGLALIWIVRRPEVV